MHPASRTWDSPAEWWLGRGDQAEVEWEPQCKAVRPPEEDHNTNSGAW